MSTPKRVAKRKPKPAPKQKQQEATSSVAAVQNKEEKENVPQPNGALKQTIPDPVPLIDAEKLWLLAKRQCTPSFRRNLVGLDKQFEYALLVSNVSRLTSKHRSLYRLLEQAITGGESQTALLMGRRGTGKTQVNPLLVSLHLTISSDCRIGSREAGQTTFEQVWSCPFKRTSTYEWPGGIESHSKFSPGHHAHRGMSCNCELIQLTSNQGGC